MALGSIFIETSGEMHSSAEDAKTLRMLEYHKGLHEHYRNLFDRMIDDIVAGRIVNLNMGNKSVRVAQAVAIKPEPEKN